MRRRTALVLSSAVALSCPVVALAGKPVSPLFSLGALSSMRINVNVMDAEPINGFTAQVVMGLTNEQDADSEFSGYGGSGIRSTSPGGSALPTTGGSPYYTIATLDSGSVGDIVSYDSAQAFDFPDAGLIDGGSNTATIIGASGQEDVTVTNALGVYATDFSHANVSGGAIIASTSALQGQYNVPILVGNQGDGLPNILGSPILAQYSATIQNSQPQHLNVGGVVYQTPKVTLGTLLGKTAPAGYSRLTLTTYDSSDALFGGGGTESSDAPLYTNFGAGTGATDPDGPASWASFFANGISLSRNGTSASGQTFLYDTGAQVTVISNDEAATLGIYNASAANADFTVQVEGVGGITDNAPGYYLSTLSVITQSGPIVWTHVPVVVLDVTDPRDTSQALPGILGTNLFSDRDLVLNANIDVASATYLAIGQQIMWNSSAGTNRNWSNANNWQVVLPNGQDMQANFYGLTPGIVNVDIPVTVGRITFDNPIAFTLSGTNTITMNDSADAAQINLRSGNHTIAVPVSLASDTMITVIPTTSTLTMSGVISSTGNYGITVGGLGTLLLSGSNTYTGDTNVASGTLTVTGSIMSKNVSTGVGAVLNASGHVNAGLSQSTILNSGGSVNLGPNLNTSGPSAVTLASIEIGSDPTSLLTLLSSPLHANRTVLVTSGISFDSTSAGQLDLKDNDMIIHGSSLAAIQPLLQSGLNAAGGTGGYWNGPGIVSSTAAASHLTALAVIKNANASGGALYSTAPGNPLGAFDGQNTSSGDILIKYTYYGDANLDGKVSSSDYTLIDNGYLTHLTGWYNGDFNYDNTINGSDYTLIDNAFNTQGAHLSVEIAAVTSQVSTGGVTSVPEPVGLGLASGLCFALLGRRTKRH